MSSCTVRVVLFDFGGVIAEEGFRLGLHEIARSNGLDPEVFASHARRALHTTGYLTGKASETRYWQALRDQAGIRGDDKDLRDMILSRFVLRDWMIGILRRMKSLSLRLVIVSDQTNWLDELEERDHFFDLFERVFNSYHVGRSKHDEHLFRDVLDELCVDAGDALFVDDTLEHVERARSAGINTIWYTGKETFLKEIAAYCPGISAPGQSTP